MRGPTLVLCTALLLAGCSGAPTDPDGPDDLAGGVPTTPGHAMHDATWAQDFHAVVGNVTGTFAPQENGAAQLATGTDTGATRLHDLDVPADRPVFVRLTLTPEPPDAALILSVQAPVEVLFTTDCDCPQGGKQVYEAAVVLAAGDSVAAQVFNANPEPVEVSYTLQTEVYGSPTVVPSGIPVAVALPTNTSHVMIEAAGDATNDVLVFGPDDALLEVLPGGAQVRFDRGERPAGEYVFVQQGHGVGASYRVGLPDDASPRVRLLEQVITSSDPTATQSGQETAWTMDGGPGLLQVGACRFTSPGVASDSELTITGPAGELVRSAVAGSAVGYTLDCPFTVMGDARLGPGAYDFSYTNGADSGSTVQGFLVQFGR